MLYFHFSTFRMQNLLACFAFLLLATPLCAQEAAPPIDKKEHKIVIQLTSSDTLVHKAIVRQIANILEAAPNSKIEVVCHSNGISLLLANQTRQAGRIAELSSKGVQFMACQNTMRERKIKPEELLRQSGLVPSGVMEVIKKQEKHWAYIRAGL